jgi:hypothetical protein
MFVHFSATQETTQNSMEPKRSLPFSKGSAAYPYPEPHESSSHPPILILYGPFQIRSFNLRLELCRRLFSSSIAVETLYALIFSPVCITSICSAHFILLDLIILNQTPY